MPETKDENYRGIVGSGPVACLPGKGCLSSLYRLLRMAKQTSILLVVRDVTKQTHKESIIRRMAFNDTLTGLPNRVLLMDRLEQAIHACSKEPFEKIFGHVVHTGTSIGIALFPEDGTDAQELIAHADAPMYAVKREGDGGVFACIGMGCNPRTAFAPAGQ